MVIEFNVHTTLNTGAIYRNVMCWKHIGGKGFEVGATREAEKKEMYDGGGKKSEKDRKS